MILTCQRVLKPGVEIEKVTYRRECALFQKTSEEFHKIVKEVDLSRDEENNQHNDRGTDDVSNEEHLSGEA